MPSIIKYTLFSDQRQTEIKGRPLASFALKPDLAAIALNNVFGDKKTPAVDWAIILSEKTWTMATVTKNHRAKTKLLIAPTACFFDRFHKLILSHALNLFEIAPAVSSFNFDFQRNFQRVNIFHYFFDLARGQDNFRLSHLKNQLVVNLQK